jgi:hypothetical protein
MSYGNGLQVILLFSDSTIVNKSAINKVKSTYSNKLQKMVFGDEEFKKLSSTCLEIDNGSQSLRKFASSRAKVNCCTLDEIKTRGRWKQASRITVDRYVCADQPHIDAKDEAVLCMGGPIKYVLLERLWYYVLVFKGARITRNNSIL